MTAIKAARTAGPWAIATITRKGHTRRVPDTKFLTYEKAENYGLEYHTSPQGIRRFVVVPHPESSMYAQHMQDVADHATYRRAAIAKAKGAA